MAFIYPMCSSSKGNCIYIGDAEEGILIDAGIGIRKFLSHLGLIGVPKEAIRGIFVTHEHSDHVSGLARIQKELGVPVYASQGTLSRLLEKGSLPLDVPMKVIEQQPEQVGGLLISAFSTPHDCVQSQAYQVMLPDGRVITVCTDLGHVTEEVHQCLAKSTVLMLESNYEPTMLQVGIYPPYLKRRIAGKQGHLSNQDCTQEICRLYDAGVRHFILGHLSEENNRPELAYANVVSELQVQKQAQLAKDFTLFVAPKSNNGTIVELG